MAGGRSGVALRVTELARVSPANLKSAAGRKSGDFRYEQLNPMPVRKFHADFRYEKPMPVESFALPADFRYKKKPAR